MISNQVNQVALNTLIDLQQRRQPFNGGGSPATVSMFENVVECHFYEPDPSTFRCQYYYNTTLNCLFRKIDINGCPYWKAISQ